MAEPVQRIVDAFQRHGLAGSVTVLPDRVIGVVEGKSFAVHIEFEGEEPIAYHSYSPDPPRTLARGNLHGLSPDRLAGLVSEGFVGYLEEALRA